MSSIARPRSRLTRPLLFAAIIAMIIALALSLGGTHLTLAGLQAHSARLTLTVARHPALSLAAYFALYIAATALSFPGALILTLGAGALFGVIEGTILVSFAASIGASLAFLTARFFLRDAALARFGSLFNRIDQGIERDGARYLISLRLAPVVPFVAINLLAGLTTLSLRRFYLASQIGMFPATLIYVNAGASLATLGQHGTILTPHLLIGLLLLAALPIAAPRLRNALTTRRRTAKFTRPQRFDRNIIVIGAGSAGLVASYVASTLRAQVTLIETGAMGGDCLNTGCVPSKALLHAARAGADFTSARAAVQTAITAIAPHDSITRYQSLGVDVRHGHAVITSPWEVHINGETLTSRAIIIAAGAEPIIPDLPGLADCPHATSATLWDLDALPARLVIIGGGPIGCEMAQAFAQLGSQVTLLDVTDRLLTREDDALSAAMLTLLHRDGVTVLTNHRAIAVLNHDGAFSLQAHHHDTTITLPFDRLLLAIGRRPRVTGYGLEQLGIPLSKTHTVETNDGLQTLYPSIFACGDVAGPYQFTHIAGQQGSFAALNALFAPLWRFKPSYRAVPAVTYTHPEFARVGLNEREARAQNIAYELTRYDFTEQDRAITEANTEGFIAVLTKPGSDQLLGAMIVGPGAGDLLTGLTIAIQNRIGLKKLLNVIYPYPTRSEAIRAVAGQWRQNHASPRGLAILARWHRFRRG